MIKGLTALPQICISKIYIDGGAKEGYNQSSPDDLYLDNKQNNPISEDEITRISFKMALKSIWQKPANPECDIVAGNKIKDILNNAKIRCKYFTDAAAFQEFEKKKTSDKKMEIFNFDGFFPGFSLDIPKLENLHNHVSYEKNTPEVTIPLEWTFLANKSETSDFLAFSFAIFLNSSGPAATILLNKKITTEVVFSGGTPATKTGYLAIDDTFSFNGQELNLLESEVYEEGPSATPGMWIPDQNTGPTDPIAKVYQNYGRPNDIWIGPYHSHPYKYKLPDGTLKTTYRLMAGQKHTKDPHPYLYYIVKDNNKIIDRRVFSDLEQLFLYNNEKEFINQLAFANKVHFLGAKKNDTLDELVNNHAIVSEPWYSIVPTPRERLIPLETGLSGFIPNDPHPEISVHTIFAIDKVKLLKNNSKMASVLDMIYRFTEPPYQGGTKFVNLLRTHRFTITRINKNTGESSLVFFTDKDIFAKGTPIDISLGPTTGGTNFRRVQPKTTPDSSMVFFEFRDGGLTDYLRKYDSSTYTYKITLEFEDPIIDWLASQLASLRSCIGQLDELLTKMSMKVFDKKSKKFVDVYNRNTDQLNPFFVDAALNPPQNTGAASAMPKFTYNFSVDEIPVAIQNAFALDGEGTENLIDAVSLESLYLLFFIYASSQENDLIPWGTYSSGLSLIGSLYKIKQYLKNSLKLSETSPTDVQKVQSLLQIIESRVVNLLQLYTTEKITKKDVGFTNRDYLDASSPSTSAVYSIIYNHTFKQNLDLSKTKDKIDWITDIHSRAPGYVDVISSQDYQDRVQMYGQGYISSEVGGIDIDTNYTYSKLPWFTTMLDLFNNNRNKWGQLSGLDLPTQQKYYQTIRKKLLANNTDKKTHVILPETLAYFGIRFDTDQPIPQWETYGPGNPGTTTTGKPNLTAGAGPGTMGPNNPGAFNDNFGAEYEPIPGIDIGKPIIGVKVKGGWGSTEDEAFEWQGGSFTSYPLRWAQSINNIINSDLATNNRKISYISDTTDELGVHPGFSDKTAPFMINVFRQKSLNVGAQIPYAYSSAFTRLLLPELSEVLFNEKDDIRFHSYPFYITFLGLFGHVEFLDGFESRPTTDNLTSTSWYHTSMVQSPIWRPLNKATLDNLTIADRLLCRVNLFQDGKYLDQETIDIYKDYYTFNKYFYITNGGNDVNIPRQFDPRNPRTIPDRGTAPRLPEDAGITEDVRDFAREIDMERIEDKNAGERILEKFPPQPDPSPIDRPGLEAQVQGFQLPAITHVTENYLSADRRDKRKR